MLWNWEFEGTPQERADLYLERSPVTYAANINTPPPPHARRGRPQVQPRASPADVHGAQSPKERGQDDTLPIRRPRRIARRQAQAARGEAAAYCGVVWEVPGRVTSDSRQTLPFAQSFDE